MLEGFRRRARHSGGRWWVTTAAASSPHVAPERLVAGGDVVAVLLGLHAARRRGQRDLLAMLVRAGHKRDVGAPQAVVASQRIGGDGGVGGAHVGGCGECKQSDEPVSGLCRQQQQQIKAVLRPVHRTGIDVIQRRRDGESVAAAGAAAVAAACVAAAAARMVASTGRRAAMCQPGAAVVKLLARGHHSQPHAPCSPHRPHANKRGPHRPSGHGR